jgi:hypothetical protein
MARTYLSALDLQRQDRPRDDHRMLSLTAERPGQNATAAPRD